MIDRFIGFSCRIAILASAVMLTQLVTLAPSAAEGSTPTAACASSLMASTIYAQNEALVQFREASGRVLSHTTSVNGHLDTPSDLVMACSAHAEVAVNPKGTPKPKTPSPSPTPGPKMLIYRPLKISGHLDRKLVFAPIAGCPGTTFRSEFTPQRAFVVSPLPGHVLIYLIGHVQIRGDGADETVGATAHITYVNGIPFVDLRSNDFGGFIAQEPHIPGCEPGRRYIGRRTMRLMLAKALEDYDKLGNFKTSCKKNPKTHKFECKIPSTSSATLAGSGTALGDGPAARDIKDTVTWSFKVKASKLKCKQLLPDGTLKDCST